MILIVLPSLCCHDSTVVQAMHKFALTSSLMSSSNHCKCSCD